mmetsp:Transcript_50669/g.68946  ORF Transcript_50669/g.68946 Transcript_50669/m.68946 type:complete len:237 (-) Transcript_50669:842-1552(-)
MISSTRKIISAASAADDKTCSLDLKLSLTPSSFISATLPSYMCNPAVFCPDAWAARSCVTRRELSYPALSAIIVGMALSDLEKASMARADFPETFATSLSIARAIAISVHPPPGIVLVMATVRARTQSASCIDLSASSRRWFEAPLKTIVHAAPPPHPENWIRRSSPIIISSISFTVPSLTDSGCSNVEHISPPVTAARRSMPSKSACSMDITLADAKISSEKLYISWRLMKQLTP